jgi:hypothetical protein
VICSGTLSMEMMYEKGVVANFNVHPENWSEPSWTKENHEGWQSGQRASRQRFELGMTQLRSRSANHCTANFRNIRGKGTISSHGYSKCQFHELIDDLRSALTGNLHLHYYMWLSHSHEIKVRNGQLRQLSWMQLRNKRFDT